MSLALPVPVAALLWFTSRRDVMGRYCNGVPTRVAATFAAAAVVTLNVVLLVEAAASRS